ncbi:MAG: preprotein translocase subunit SecY [Bacteroidota bacterium]|jgi:preprotein translocase subunit SecY
MNKFFQTIANVFRIEELKQRILYTALILLVVRIGSYVPLPGVDVIALQASKGGDSNTLFGLYDLFVGGALSNASIFALGIMPYISASIILQLAGIVMPEVQRLQREGEEGRKKITQFTRYLTVLIACLQAWGVSIKIANPGTSAASAVAPDMVAWFTFTSIILLSSGTIFLMWLGEQITERGLGNGISLIIFIGIVARLPDAIFAEINYINSTPQLFVHLIIFAILVFIIAGVVLITQGARRIPVQYAKRVVGKKVYGGTTQYIPLRVNTSGVMPIIFAQSILFVPSTILSFFPENTTLQWISSQLFREQSYIYALTYSTLIVFFTYFYTAVAFNPRDVADNMKKQGGFIPGIRPGAPTADYIENILTRITLPGAMFLALIAIMPTFVSNVLRVQPSFASFFGGTSLLIVVGVALDTLQQVESYLLMRHYDGFMKSGKIRGRANSGAGGF